MSMMDDRVFKQCDWDLTIVWPDGKRRSIVIDLKGALQIVECYTYHYDIGELKITLVRFMK